jgi:phage shock protein A
MGVMKRVSMIFKSKANKALDRMEDPRETLDYSYQRQLEMLTKVRRGVADVATSRKRIELQMNQLSQQQAKLDKQARDALAVGREDLAREALTRKSSVQGQVNGLQTQYASLQAEEEKLTRASQGLQAKVEAFRSQKETIKATYTAAEAQTRIGEAFSGISEEMGDVGMAVQRAEDKTAQMQARAGAIDELLASGALDDVTGPPRDDIQAELDRMGSSSDVELELAKIKGELDHGEAPRQIEGTQADGEGQAAQAAAQQPSQPSNGAEQAGAQAGPGQPAAPAQPAPPAQSGSEPQNPAGEGA